MILFLKVVKDHGGRVLCKAHVKSILVEDGKAAGVQMEDGTKLKAPLVVSAVGHENTRDLLDCFDQKTKDEKIMPPAPIGPSAGYLMINLGFNVSGRQAGIPCCNKMIMPSVDGDIMEATARYRNDSKSFRPPVFITFPSVKDRAAYDKPLSCQLLTMAKYDWFEKFSDEAKEFYYSKRSGEPRGNEYAKEKEWWAKTMCETLFEHYPQLKDHVDLMDVSTPLTIEHYLNEPRGGACGLDTCPERFQWEPFQDMRVDSVPGTNYFYVKIKFYLTVQKFKQQFD